MPAHPQNLAWIDLEMTGLDPERDRIIEIATIVTDKDLNVLAEGPVFAVHQSDAQLASMDDWNTRTHGGSGLTQRVRESAVDDGAAEAATLKFLARWVPERPRSRPWATGACISRSRIARPRPRPSR